MTHVWKRKGRMYGSLNTVANQGHDENKNIAANILKFVQMYYKFLQIH